MIFSEVGFFIPYLRQLCAAYISRGETIAYPSTSFDQAQFSPEHAALLDALAEAAVEDDDDTGLDSSSIHPPNAGASSYLDAGVL